MLKARHLVKEFGTIKAVMGVSLDLEKGDVLGLLGPNGAGKSTTMKMITGYLEADSGEVEINGINIEEDPIGAKRNLGYLPETAPLYDEMRVIDFLNFIAEVRGLKGHQKRKHVNRAIEMCFLNQVTRQSIYTLSKGYRHRTCFAQAILHDPAMLILDEPTDGLDPNQKHEMRNMIKEMGREKAIIVSTHILEEVDAVCSRVALMNYGQVIFNGTPEDLRAVSPDHKALFVQLTAQNPHEILLSLKENFPKAKFLVDELESNYIRVKVHHHKKELNFNDRFFSLCKDKQWRIDNLETKEGRLDEVFRTLTMPNSRTDWPTASLIWNKRNDPTVTGDLGKL